MTLSVTHLTYFVEHLITNQMIITSNHHLILDNNYGKVPEKKKTTEKNCFGMSGALILTMCYYILEPFWTILDHFDHFDRFDRF